MKVGIIGLGLMGGSFAKALKKYFIAKSVIGYIHNDKHKNDILELKLVDELVSFERLKAESDVIVLAIPVDKILEYMNQLKDIDKNTTIIDLGSTKKLIVDNIPAQIRENFVAAHPMTGTEKFGPRAAMDGLYEGKTVVLCDLENNSELHKDRALRIFQEIGMRIVQMSAESHDIHACYMSHLPHAISFSLANTVMNHEDPKSIIALAAGGFKDMSRVAKSSPNMWTDIFKQNKSNLLSSITIFQNQLQHAKELIEAENYDDLHKWMEKANTLHEIL